MAGSDDQVFEASQQGRLLTVKIGSLDEDLLLATSLIGHEAISSMFSFSLDLISQKPEQVIFDQIIGQNITISLRLADDSQRFFNGFVSRFSLVGRETGAEHRFTHYHIEVVPWLWFLSKITDCRIFQEKTVPEIVGQIFEDHGFLDFRNNLSRTYTSWDYCVQYRETDFQFVSRLLEEEGIFYFFEHEQDKHVLVLADSPQVYQPCPGQPTAIFEPEGGIGEREDTVNSWVVEQELHSGKVTNRDYHFEMPSKPLEFSETTRFSVAQNDKLEIYDYPGGYAEKFNKPGERLDKVEPEGRQMVEIQMEEQETPHLLHQGSSDCRAFAAGTTFQLTSPPPGVTEGPYVLTSIQHSATQDSSFISGDSDVSVSYSNTFTCIPDSTQYRPRRITPKPIIPGPQAAEVVGPKGEEIFVDKYGRVKVQFNWDRKGEHNEKSSAWLRVCQIWAGKNWGAMFIPRVGQEVMVDFLEGDPDQPVVIGRLYNGDNLPFYELPKFKTISGIKSNSSPGGKGFNELRFEDKKGKEQVFIHSQKRMDVRVRESMYETIGGTRQICVGGNLALTVGGDTDIHLKQSLFEGIDSKLNQGVKGDVVFDYQSNDATVVKANYELNARQITIEALTQITLKVGSSFVVIDLTGVTIQGPIVKINSGGAAAGTGPAVIDDPLDCEGADTGEPGFLDKPRSGKGKGRRRRTLNGHHAPDVKYDPATGNFQVGKNINISGTDDFKKKALNDIADIGDTPTGKQLLDDIDAGTHKVNIQESPTDPKTGKKSPGFARKADPAAAEEPGKGSDTTIFYDPDGTKVKDQNGNPIDIPGKEILGHEMIHADHNSQGTNLTSQPDPKDPTGNQEESRTIGINDHKDEPISENKLLEDWGADYRRTDHDGGFVRK
jgi:type VI secretion system secreted protein VgrG